MIFLFFIAFIYFMFGRRKKKFFFLKNLVISLEIAISLIFLSLFIFSEYILAFSGKLKNNILVVVCYFPLKKFSPDKAEWRSLIVKNQTLLHYFSNTFPSNAALEEVPYPLVLT
jgi:hypothetical protein